MDKARDNAKKARTTPRRPGQRREGQGNRQEPQPESKSEPEAKSEPESEAKGRSKGEGRGSIQGVDSERRAKQIEALESRIETMMEQLKKLRPRPLKRTKTRTRRVDRSTPKLTKLPENLLQTSRPVAVTERTDPATSGIAHPVTATGQDALILPDAPKMPRELGLNFPPMSGIVHEPADARRMLAGQDLVVKSAIDGQGQRQPQQGHRNGSARRRAAHPPPSWRLQATFSSDFSRSWRVVLRGAALEVARLPKTCGT